jgi:hypothetical protein
MALKPHRKPGQGTDISFFMNEVAERGGIVTFDTATTGVGAAMDDSNASVQVPTTTGDGIAAGLLVNDVVDLDLTRQHLNQHQDEVQVNSKVTIATRGEYTTNRIAAGQTPQAGDDAYFAATGLLSTSAGSAKVGRFLSGLDTDCYCKVYINLP